MLKIGTTQAVYCEKYGFREGLERYCNFRM